jgi:hypothetical protein
VSWSDGTDETGRGSGSGARGVGWAPAERCASVSSTEINDGASHACSRFTSVRVHGRIPDISTAPAEEQATHGSAERLAAYLRELWDYFGRP